MIDLEKMLADVASKRVEIKPFTAAEKREKCTCGHYKRYHIVVFDRLLCKYKCSCKGYKVKVVDAGQEEKK